MSAGHSHKRQNLRHPAELKKLRREGGFEQLWQRWQGLNVDYDIPDLAGYNVPGTLRYIDKDAFRALLDPEYARKIGVGPIRTGLTPEQTVDALAEHEGIEKVLLDADNDEDLYDAAHELATCGEHLLIKEEFGGSPVKYERGLKKIIDWCERKTPQNVPQDYACAPYVDEPDSRDQRILKVLRRLGITDASKLGRKVVHYSKSTGTDQCRGCAHWQDDRGQELSVCAKVSGLVRCDRWCDQYQAVEGQDGDTEGGDAEQDAEQQLRPAGGAEVSDAGPEPRSEREGAGDAGGEGGPDVDVDGSEDQSQGEPKVG